MHRKDLQLEHTTESQLGKNQKIEAIKVFGVCLVQDSIGAVQIIVDVPDLGGKLEAGDLHCGDPGLWYPAAAEDASVWESLGGRLAPCIRGPGTVKVQCRPQTVESTTVRA